MGGVGAPSPVGGAGEGAGVGASFEGLLLSGLFPDPASDDAPIILCILCTITMACINCCGGSWPELLLLNNVFCCYQNILECVCVRQGIKNGQDRSKSRLLE